MQTRNKLTILFFSACTTVVLLSWLTGFFVLQTSYRKYDTTTLKSKSITLAKTFRHMESMVDRSTSFLGKILKNDIDYWLNNDERTYPDLSSLYLDLILISKGGRQKILSAYTPHTDALYKDPEAAKQLNEFLDFNYLTTGIAKTPKGLAVCSRYTARDDNNQPYTITGLSLLDQRKLDKLRERFQTDFVLKKITFGPNDTFVPIQDAVTDINGVLTARTLLNDIRDHTSIELATTLNSTRKQVRVGLMVSSLVFLILSIGAFFVFMQFAQKKITTKLTEVTNFVSSANNVRNIHVLLKPEDKANTKDHINQHINQMLTTLESSIKELEKNDLQFNRLFKHMLNGFCFNEIITHNGNEPVDFKILKVNKAFERMTDCKKEDIEGKQASKAFPFLFLSKKHLLKVVGQVALTGKEVTFEEYIETLDRWFSVSVYCPEHRYFVTLFDDITVRKNAEQTLKDRDAMLQGVADSLNCLLTIDNFKTAIEQVLGILGQTTKINRVYIFENSEYKGKMYMSQIFEWTSESALTMQGNPELQNVSYADLAPTWFENLSEGNPIKGTIDSFEYPTREILAKQNIKSILVVPIFTGEKFWGFIGFDDCQKHRIWNENEISILFAAAASIGGAIWRKKAEDQIQASEARFRAIVNDQTELICRFDLTGTMTFSNKAFCRFFDYIPDHTEQKKVYDFVPGGTLAKFDEKIKLLTQQTPVQSLQLKFTNIKNQMRWTQWTYRLIQNSQGQDMEIQAVGRDITEEKLAQEKIQEAIDMKSRFVSMVSHELRTPLIGIKEGIGIVFDESTGPLNTSQKEFLEMGKKSVDRLHRLINDVLDFSKLESGKAQFNIEPNNINQAVLDGIQGQKIIARQKNIKLITNLDESLPKIQFSYDKIIQIINNLLNNALRFTAKGSITVSTGFCEEKQSAYCSITDTGEGIKKEDIPKLFNKFQQVGSRRKTGGTGLGLAICKEIIEQHGGSIGVSSEFGKGSTFTFYIPVKIKQPQQVS